MILKYDSCKTSIIIHNFVDHPKTRAFLSHCGMNSVCETAFFGIPAACVPFFIDQNRNVRMLEQRKMGLKLSKEDTNRDNVVTVINELLYNKQ